MQSQGGCLPFGVFPMPTLRGILEMKKDAQTPSETALDRGSSPSGSRKSVPSSARRLAVQGLARRFGQRRSEGPGLWLLTCLWHCGIGAARSKHTRQETFATYCSASLYLTRPWPQQPSPHWLSTGCSKPFVPGEPALEDRAASLQFGRLKC